MRRYMHVCCWASIQLHQEKKMIATSPLAQSGKETAVVEQHTHTIILLMGSDKFIKKIFYIQ